MIIAAAEAHVHAYGECGVEAGRDAAERREMDARGGDPVVEPPVFAVQMHIVLEVVELLLIASLMCAASACASGCARASACACACGSRKVVGMELLWWQVLGSSSALEHLREMPARAALRLCAHQTMLSDFEC